MNVSELLAILSEKENGAETDTIRENTDSLMLTFKQFSRNNPLDVRFAARNCVKTH